jgi:hypothetical protein
MKFAEKYEIIEMVTSGRVSTFLARDRASQEPVVVYTFECAGATELSTASIIARFCGLAPNPPGIIVKAGFDAESSSAFLTTKVPGAEALRQWTKAYHAFGQQQPQPVGNPDDEETAEISSAELKAFLGTRSPAHSAPEESGEVTAAFSLDSPPPPPPRSAGDFTRLFREANAFEPLQSSRVSKPPSAPTGNATDAILGQRSGSVFPTEYTPPAAPVSPSSPDSPGPEPGSFTSEFLALSSEKSNEKTGVKAPGPSKTSTPLLPQKEVGSFTAEFLAVSEQSGGKHYAEVARPTDPPSSPASKRAAIMSSIFGPDATKLETSATNQPAGGGEFTRFFGNPFDQPGTLEKSPVASTEIPDLASSAPPKQPTGDFTRMFGRDDVVAASSQPTEQDHHPIGGSFTQIFTDAANQGGAKLGSSTLDTYHGVRPSSAEPVLPPNPPAPSKPVPTAVSPTPDLFSARPPAPVQLANPSQLDRPISNRPNAIGATDIFRTPIAEAPPARDLPSGPSEFTVFLSRSEIAASLPPELPAPGGGGGSLGAGQPAGIAPPPIPQPPPFQFAPPPPPPVPAIKFPPVPAPPVSAAPAAKPPAAPAKAASYWPLITVLTALVAIAAMLIMYFALKH